MTTAFSTLKVRLRKMIGDTEGVYDHLYDDAINDASRELYPILLKYILDETLTTEDDLETDSDYEYLLPVNSFAAEGHLSQVHLQVTGDTYEEVFGWKVINDGTNQYLRMPDVVSGGKTIRLVGYGPLEDDLSAANSTLSLDTGRHITILLRYAAHLIYEMQAGVVSSDDRKRLQDESDRWFVKAHMLINQGGRMPKPQGAISWSV